MKDNRIGWIILTVLMLIAIYAIFRFLGTIFWYAIIGLFVAGVLYFMFRKNKENK